MRRPVNQAVGELDRLARALRLFRDGKDGNRLPKYTEQIVFYLAAQPERTAGVGDIRKFLGLGKSRTSRLCAVLMDSGLAEIIIPPDDRRSANIKLTAKGIQLTDRFLTLLHSDGHQHR